MFASDPNPFAGKSKQTIVRESKGKSMRKTFKLTYRENNETTTFGTFDSQEGLDILIKAECELIEKESAMSRYEREDLINALLTWALSQWNPNASKTFSFHYDSNTVGTWTIEEA